MSTPLPLRDTSAGLLDQSRRVWLVAAVAIALGLLSLGLIYSAEIAAAIGVWIASTAFNHCFLILPIAAYLLYARWDSVAAAVPRPSPLIGLAAVPVAACWFIVERAGIMEARQFFAMGIAQILLLAVLGPKTWRVAAAPLLYLFFLVPAGEYLVPWLQDFTVRFISLGLKVLGIPHFIGGITIEIPEGSFLVAEACAGLRFLVASVAFGVLYALLSYTSPWRRLIFVALSFVVPVIANGFRALGITVLGHILGSAQAAEVDHVLYGWVFFAIVTALLILAGLPFRQTARPVLIARPPVSAVPATLAAMAVVAVVAVAAAPRLLANGLDHAALSQAAVLPVELPIPAGCSPSAPVMVLAKPADESVAATLTGSYRCGDDRLTVHLAVFPPRIGAGPVFAALRGASILPDWDELTAGTAAFGSGDAASKWRVSDLARDGKFISVASSLWIDGEPSPGGVAARFRQALAVLRRDALSPVLAVVTTDVSSDRQRPHRAIERLLDTPDGLANIIARLGRKPAANSATQ
jgi:exosortase A